MNKPTNKAAIPVTSDETEHPITNRKICRLLVANRGEIACRVIATAKKMGIETIAVYSEVDRSSKHVDIADRAILIGKAPAADSYLNINNIINAAKTTKADAIHPGYGFLSENAQFAEACQKNAITFIGPPSKAMLAMSSKSEAKSIMEKAQVPLIPGYHGEDNTVETLLNIADKIGYPVLLKAALGGGGKGMRIVNSSDEMPESIASAHREAKSAFGDDKLLIEKYLPNSRHIEIQIFADEFGNTIYLSDRDCSIQRRHQKIIEEAPAPNLPISLRKTMGEAAVNAAKAISYIGAGTVEFLLDNEDNFYFMEMNTRLQVEHPVTELITGQDLVEWQIKVAEGAPLPLSQDQVHHHGHAIEARIYAEDPENDFIPSSGHIQLLQEPKPQSTHNSTIRVDSGIRKGDAVTSHYDPMLAKLIVWSENRELATHEVSSALANYRLIGLTTNIQYLQKIIRHPAFREARLNTHIIEHFRDDFENANAPTHRLTCDSSNSRKIEQTVPKLALFAAIAAIGENLTSQITPHFHNWRLNQPPYQDIPICLPHGDCYQFRFKLPLTALKTGKSTEHSTGTKKLFLTQVTIHTQSRKQQSQFSTNQKINVLSASIKPHSKKQTDFHIEIDGASARFAVIHCQKQYHVFHQLWYEHFVIGHNTDYQHIQDEENQALAPLNGIITAILCQPGDNVEKDQPLLIIEAMKMEYTVRAPHAGTIANYDFSLGDQVEHGEQLVKFKSINKGA
ncbi:acetyl-CoA carboxylase biotin carboxylase subunit [uncultured Photobacterium sp.]|uniref:acetyl-CoA carboxylase biotin carboxylase subunit n=1 Tax=uncultured Photobacterium sp. TaxID=173973 RepID=UPI0026198056|nr:acetyl-CoA carboxylase biotin carboxylase subunit [uncultured Photobacterium sp.]